MPDKLDFYIDGRWVPPVEPRSFDVINPATEAVVTRSHSARIRTRRRAGVAAARQAFDCYSLTSQQERLRRCSNASSWSSAAPHGDLAGAVTAEMGAPAWLAAMPQVPPCAAHFRPRPYGR